MNGKLTKSLAMLLALLMMFSLLPVSAFAADGEESGTPEEISADVPEDILPAAVEDPAAEEAVIPEEITADVPESPSEELPEEPEEDSELQLMADEPKQNTITLAFAGYDGTYNTGVDWYISGEGKKATLNIDWKDADDHPLSGELAWSMDDTHSGTVTVSNGSGSLEFLLSDLIGENISSLTKTVTVSFAGDESYAGAEASKDFTVHPEKYTLSFDANGGSGTMESVLVTPHSFYALPECTFIPPFGKVFAGWYFNETTTLQPGSKIDLGGNRTQKPVWEDGPIVITADTPSGSTDGIAWDAATATLTLTDAAISCALELGTDMTVSLSGSSTVSSASEDGGIRVFDGAGVTVLGSGSLTLNYAGSADAVLFGNNTSFTLKAKLNINVTNTALEGSALGGNCTLRIIEGGEMNITLASANTWGIYVDNFIMDGNSVFTVTRPAGAPGNFRCLVETDSGIDIGESSISSDKAWFASSGWWWIDVASDATYFRIGKSTEPWIRISEGSETTPYLFGGLKCKLAADAKVKNGTGSIHYQWYKGQYDSSNHFELIPVSGATSRIYEMKSDGAEYYCVASATVGGKTLSSGLCFYTYDGSLHLNDSTPSFNYLSTAGVSWNADNKVLTLKNASLQGLYFQTGASVILQGDSVLTAEDRPLYLNNCEISIGGSGSLKLVSTGTYYALMYSGGLTIENGAAVTVLSSASDYPAVLIDKNSRLTVKGTLNVEQPGRKITVYGLDNSTLAVTDGGKLTIKAAGGTSLAPVDMEIGTADLRGGKLICDGAEAYLSGQMVLIAKTLLLDDAPVFGNCSSGTVSGCYVLTADSATSRWAYGVSLPSLKFKTSLADNVYTASLGGKAPVIKADAVLTGGTATITYTWYETDSYTGDYQAGAVKAATGLSFTAPITERGVKYYFCVASAKIGGVTYLAESGVFSVCTGEKGTVVNTEGIDISSYDPDKSGTGWSYSASTHTLTLSGVDFLAPFDSFTYPLSVSFRELNIVLQPGTRNLLGRIHSSYSTKLNISGSGWLQYNGLETSSSVGAVIVTDGASLEITGGTPNASLSELSVTDGEVRSDGTIRTEKLIVGAAGKVFVSCMDFGSSSASVGGVLSCCKPGGYALHYQAKYGEEAARLLPLTDGAELRIATAEEVLIAPPGYERLRVTGISAVTGNPQVGQNLTAGSVQPAGATAKFIWQFAGTKTTPDELWEDYPSSGSEFTVSDSFVGKYVRVKAVGIGEYSGEVYSAAVGPVTAPGTYLLSLFVNNEAVDLNHGSAFIDTYSDTVSVTAVPANPAALITIENVTTGEKAEGASGVFTVPWNGGNGGEFDWYHFKITVRSDGEVKVYDNVNIVSGYRQTYVDLSPSEDASLTISWEDGEGSHSETPAGSWNHNFNPNTQITIEGRALHDGWYFSGFGNSLLDSVAEQGTDGVLRATFTTGRAGSPSVYAYTRCRCAAPSLDFVWSLEGGQYYLRPVGDTSYTPWAADSCTAELVMMLCIDEENNRWNYFDYSGTRSPLDPKQSYKLKCYYNNSNCDDLVVEVPPMAAEISLAENHIVVENPADGESIARTIKVDIPQPLWVSDFQMAVFGPDSDRILPSCDGQELVVTVSRCALPGTSYVMLSAKAPDGSLASTVLKVDVIESGSTVSAALTVNTGSLNVYQDATLAIPVNVVGSSAKIVSAAFDNEKFNRLCTLTPSQSSDRELILGWQEIEDDGTFDWAARAKSLAGTYTGKIVLTLADGKEIATAGTYTLKAGAAAPAVKGAAVKFNSFYQNQQQPLVFTFKGGTVVKAAADTGKSRLAGPACPDWLTLADDGLSATLNSAALANGKGSGKLYLKVWPEGYRLPVQVAVSVSAVKTVPGVKLQQPTVTVPANGGRTSQIWLQLLPTAKGTEFSDLNITGIRVATKADLYHMSAAERKPYTALSNLTAEGFFAYEFCVTGKFCLSPASSSEVVAGKILLIATVGGNAAQEIYLPLTVKTLATNTFTLKADKTSITINPTLGWSGDRTTDSKQVALVPSAAGLDLGTPDVKVTDLNGQGDYSDIVFVDRVSAYDAFYTYNVCAKADAPDGTYLVVFTADGFASPVTVKVIIKNAAPKVKLSKTTLTLDRTDFSAEEKILLTADSSLFNFSSYDGSQELQVVDAKGARHDDFFDYTLNRMAEGNKAELIIRLRSPDNLVDGKYMLTFICGPCSAKFTVNVKSKAPALKADKTTVTLNSDLPYIDTASVKLTSPEEYIYYGSEPTVEVYDANGQSAEICMNCYYVYEGPASGTLRLQATYSAQPGATYKVKLHRTVNAKGTRLETNTVVITVKIAAQKNGITPVAAGKLSAAALDLSKQDATAKVAGVFTGWNGMITDTDNSRSPVVQWYVFAADTRDCQVSGGYTIGADNLVASSENTDYSWFVDTDETPGGISLAVNRNSTAWTDSQIYPGLKYTLKVVTTFRKYYADDSDLQTVKTAEFKLTAGTAKITAEPTAVTLSKKDSLDSKIIKIAIPDGLRPIQMITIANAARSQYDATLLYIRGGYAYVAIGWKNDMLPLIPAGATLTLQLYLEGNNVYMNKPNGTAKVTVKTA